MSDRFSEPEPATAIKFTSFVICVICVFLLIWMAYRIQRRKSQPKKARPMGLFLRMQAGLGLPLLDRWYLWRLARVANVAQPTALLISEALYDQAVATYCGTRGQSNQTIFARYRLIRERLFDKLGEDHLKP